MAVEDLQNNLPTPVAHNMESTFQGDNQAPLTRISLESLSPISSQTTSNHPDVSPTEESDTDGYGSIAVANNPLSVGQSLSLSGFFIILGGSVLIIFAVAFLIFLWTGEGPADGANTTRLWRLIVLRDWTARAVTLSSLVLRSVITAQTVVCTSLVAALLLERRQVRLSQVTRMSITRSVNNGPQQLIQDIIASRSLRIISSLEAMLLTVLAIGSFGVQFSSTILLSDFKDTSIVQDPVTIRQNISLSPERAHDAYNLIDSSWIYLEAAMARFAERNSGTAAEPNEYGVSHSGPKERVFLPFEQEDRIRMRSFKGTSFTLKTEVSCLRPSITAFGEPRISYGKHRSIAIAGDISYGQTFNNVGFNHSKASVRVTTDDEADGYLVSTYPSQSFDCTIPLDMDLDGSTWILSMCVLNRKFVKTDKYGPDIYRLEIYNDHFRPTSILFLVFASIGNPFLSNRSLEVPIPYGEWNSYELYPGSFLNISLCFATLNTTVSEVEIASKSDFIEPEFKWSTSLNTPSLNALQKFMGADAAPASIDERGIFTIENMQYPVSSAAFTEEVDRSTAEDIIMFTESCWWSGLYVKLESFVNSSNLCNFCSAQSETASKDGAALFMQIINSSNRVAVAIDTYITRLAQTFFYLMLPLFNVPEDIEAVFSTNVSIPRQWDGLITVLIMVVIDLTCVWIITVLYVRNVRYSRQGDFWHAISQLMAEATLPILQQSRESGDREIGRLLEGNDPFVTINRSAETRNVEVLRVY